MPRILFAFLFAATFTAATLGQTPNQPETVPTCNLSLSQAPAIRGIRLGMKPDEWLKLFPGSEQDVRLKAFLDRPPQYPEYGWRQISLLPPSELGSHETWFKVLPGEEFSGVDRVSLTLFDNQITEIRVSYSPTYVNNRTMTVWDDVSQLIPVFSEAFNLPNIAAWEKAGSGACRLRCPGFDMELSILNSTVQAMLKTKSNFGQILHQRSEADKQKRRAAFKP